MGSESLRKDIEQFQAAVKKLSIGISKASSLWKDQNYYALSSSISELASQSKDVLVSGDKCCNLIDKFDKIASENY